MAELDMNYCYEKHYSSPSPTSQAEYQSDSDPTALRGTTTTNTSFVEKLIEIGTTGSCF